ncbi:hypothetical protein ARMSODRAFT_1022760 [Armillaria solidipes]|uniref:Uncharacterized protein n=1 Tax=Armillaria solidipes TaxID=1076256 RepID=A0A2H3B1J8_9AGAR|nr:hypothetical protein ARMSODRAFT_1022760 [Armillaria solidipes]
MTNPSTLPRTLCHPYVQPRPLVERVDPRTPNPQRRTPYQQNPSDEHLPSQNATLGPSNVLRTPPPAYDPTEAEDYSRYLRARFRSPTPDLPLIMIPNSPEPPNGEESPCCSSSLGSNPDPENPEQIWVYQPHPRRPYQNHVQPPPAPLSPPRLG